MSSSSSSFFDRLGGESKLRAIVNDFVDRVFEDQMIGFFFAKADRGRIKEKEWELAARHLGADVAYSGRGLGQAHAPHRIMGGHFMRRLQILRETLERHQVPSDVMEHWIKTNEEMRAVITADQGGECTDPEVAESTTSAGPQPQDETTSSGRPIPSAAEINAYLEKSAANTKRRLTLAGGGVAPKPSATGPRALPLTKKK